MHIHVGECGLDINDMTSAYQTRTGQALDKVLGNSILRKAVPKVIYVLRSRINFDLRPSGWNSDICSLEYASDCK